MLSDKEFRVLLAQYGECLDFIRSYAQHIWQIPSLTMAVNSFLVIAYLGYAKTSFARTLILVAALAFTWVSTLQLEKHRFFQQAKIAEFKHIQERLMTECPSMLEIRFATKEIFDDKIMYADVDRNWVRRQKAFVWLTRVQYLFAGAIVALLVSEIFLNFFSITILSK